MEPSSTNAEAPPTPQADLANLIRYAQRIERWTAGKSFTDYQPDLILNSAVEREFIEIGAIIHRFETAAPELYRQLPEAGNWYAFRIILVHIRWEIDQQIVWEAARKDLPALIAAATNLLPSQQTLPD